MRNTHFSENSCRRLKTLLTVMALAGIVLFAAVAEAGPLLQSDDLVGYWKLDEPTGGTARDSAGAGYHGSFSGATRTSGMFAGAADFAGNNEYVGLPSNSVLDALQEGDYTLSAWVRPDQLPPGTGSANDASYGIVEKAGYHSGIRYTNTGNLAVDAWRTGDVNVSTSSASTYAPSAWNHVVSVVSKTNGTVTLYVNGTQAGSTTFAPGTDAREYGTTPWRIGIANPGSGSYRWPMNGSVDEVAIWDAPLSADQVGLLHDLYTGNLPAIADFRDDFQGTSPAAGWQYLWNRDGAIGDAGNYAPLLWTGGDYDSNGTAGLPDPSPARYMSLNATGGHPGAAAGQSEAPGNTFDRYAITAYTVGAGGDYFLTDGLLAMNNPDRSVGTHTLDLRIYVNDDLQYAESGVDSTAFHLALGELDAGDTIYVAVGPNGLDYYDAFNLDYTVAGNVLIPEPSTLLLLAFGAVGLLVFARRKTGRANPPATCDAA